MQNQFDERTSTGWAQPGTISVPRAARDAGLRSYMLKVYNYMASGVLLTGIVAMLFANSSYAVPVLTSPLRWLIILSPLAIVFAMSFGVNRMKESTLPDGPVDVVGFPGVHGRVDRADLFRRHGIFPGA
jgi:uncharacterized protein